jgi:hypothetical protein
LVPLEGDLCDKLEELARFVRRQARNVVNDVAASMSDRRSGREAYILEPVSKEPAPRAATAYSAFGYAVDSASLSSPLY